MNKGTLYMVAEAWTDSEASVIKSLLESYEIPCFCESRMPRNIYPLALDGVIEIRIYVPELLAEEADRILRDHRRPHRHLRLVERDEKKDTS